MASDAESWRWRAELESGSSLETVGWDERRGEGEVVGEAAERVVVDERTGRAAAAGDVGECLSRSLRDE